MHFANKPRHRSLRTVIGAAALCALSMTAGAQTNGNSVTLLTMSPNPAGIQFGFWENQVYQYQTFATFGHRSTARVAIDSWASIEPKQTATQPAGTYDWSNFDQTTTADLAATHQYGETILAAVNVSFTPYTGGTKSTIPATYTPDITVPATRTAAKNFITAYVQHLASKVGSFTMTVDYEIVSNYDLESSTGDNCASNLWYQCRLTRANTWAAWFAEAAQTARAAMAAYNSQYGTNFVLQVEPIVNGDVINPSNPVNGASDAGWIATMVAASDTIALDNYHCNDGQVVTNADGEIAAITTWNSLIGNTPKRLIVAENGFSSGLPAVTGGNVCEENNLTQGKYKGTPAEQAAYYTDLFTKLKAATQPGGNLHGRLQSFNIWSIIDNPLLQSQAATDSDYDFGVVAQPPGPPPALGAPKPATPVVASGIAGFESDPDLAPVIQKTSETWTNKLQTGAPVVFNGGADHSFLRYVGNTIGTASGTNTACYANVRLDHALAGDMLMIEADGHDWIIRPVTPSVGAVMTSIPLSATQCSGEGSGHLQLDVYVTGSSFPASHKVSAITATSTPAVTPSAQGLRQAAR